MDNLNSNDFENNEVVHRSRRARKMEEQSRMAQTAPKESGADNSSNKKNNKKANKPKKKHSVLKTILKLIIFLVIICFVIGAAFVGSIIAKAPKIETDDIDSLLSQSTILYNDKGNIIDNVFSQNNRTLVEISKIPKHTQHAFIALEDKTFETHHGFNIIRLFGAVKDALTNGGHVSGTSTITQQLARNLYLTQERSIKRKILEAYYTVVLERNLTKDQILEAYLNTVYFGSTYGIQTASQAYFSKDVEDLTIAESAALASIPQSPNAYALVITVPVEQVTEDTKNLIAKNGSYAYLWNDTCTPRMQTCLKLMFDQGFISEKQYNKAKKRTVKNMVKPSIEALDTVSNYFADYVLKTVIHDFQEQNKWSYEKAADMVYNRGIRIYTTMDSQAQAVVEREYENDANFPQPVGYSKDSRGNILSPETGKPLLFSHSYYIDGDGSFRLRKGEFRKKSDGSLLIYAGKRLAIYDTQVEGKTDYSVEFKTMYTIDNGKLYTIPGGYLNIPQEYKSKNKKGNLIISKKFLDEHPNFFVDEGSTISTKEFSLKQKVIQPQSAMTIIDNKTGAIKAMIGGRKIAGRMVFNRATAPRQPGSSIKPVAVYSAALQKSYELAAQNQSFPFIKTGYDKQGTSLWGKYITAASIVNDEPMTVNGKLWPRNSYNGYRGLTTFRTALQQSINVCAVKILAQVGVDYSYQHSKKFGITTLVDSPGTNDLNLAALAMGGMTKGVSTLEMASAYSTFVSNGVHKSHSCYTKVTDRNGNILLEPKITKTKVLDPGVAWITRDILQTVVSEGIGSYARISGASVGGKTGTTSDNYDIWFDGFTAKYSAALWIGNDVNLKLSSMSPAAATLWGKIMSQCSRALGGTYSPAPSNVTSASIDMSSGLLAGDDSRRTRKEYFTKGTEPTESGSLYRTVVICTESGFLATPSCTHTKEITGLIGEYGISGQDVIPKFYCHLHNPDPSEYPADPDKEVTIVEIPTDDPEEDDEDIATDGDITIEPPPDEMTGGKRKKH